MPYITQERRERFNWLIGMILYERPNVGDLNYIFTKLLLGTKPKRYEDYNALMGVLSCCAQEFYRKFVVKYEEEKEKENGAINA